MSAGAQVHTLTSRHATLILMYNGRVRILKTVNVVTNAWVKTQLDRLDSHRNRVWSVFLLLLLTSPFPLSANENPVVLDPAYIHKAFTHKAFTHKWSTSEALTNRTNTTKLVASFTVSNNAVESQTAARPVAERPATADPVAATAENPTDEKAAITELLMVEEKGCVYCAKFDREIAEAYPKTTEGKAAPLRRLDLHQRWPADLEQIDRPAYTPTFILVHNNKEIGRLIGYNGDEYFWFLIGELLQNIDNEDSDS